LQKGGTVIPEAPHHLALSPNDVAGNQGIGRVCLLPGSEARARAIADRLDDLVVRPSPRQLNGYLGVVRRDGASVDVLAIPTGMGCPSLNIVVSELFGLGARRFLRVGSAGSLQQEVVRAGALVIASAAVRDEGTSDAFCPRSVPALAHPDWIDALASSATDLGLGKNTWLGPVQTKDCLYGGEFPGGPLADRNAAHMRMLHDLGVLATEMESAHLFVLASVLNRAITPLDRLGSGPDAVKAGSVLAIIGDERPFAPVDLALLAEKAAIDVSIEAAFRLVLKEMAERVAPSPTGGPADTAH
jgi:uridine phosphorylase